MRSGFLRKLLPAALSALLTACVVTEPAGTTSDKVVPAPTLGPGDQRIIVSVAEQKMVLFERGRPFAVVPVSTSKFGVGDVPGSKRTPLGRFEVAEIVGHGLPIGAKLKSRVPTGEVVPVNAPGRDNIVTRVVRLRGMEPGNKNALDRCIYFHGTTNEASLKTPASYGCVRMRSWQIARMCNWAQIGARVDIVEGRLPAPGQLPP